MYYGYIRVSTETQAVKGGGLEVQEAQIRGYADTHGIELQAIFSDKGISGTDENRPGLDEMFSALEKGDCVIVQNTNRLWRDIFNEAAVLKTMLQIGAEIISIDEPELSINKILHDPEGALMFGVMGAIAQYQRLEIIRKLSRGRATKASKGDKPAGICPYGYQYTADKKHVEVDEAAAAAVRLMFSEGQKGKSLAQIAEIVTEKGYTAPRGGRWSAGSVQAILRNRFYIGELTHQGKTIAGNHTPLISKVQFGKVSAQLQSRKRG